MADNNNTDFTLPKNAYACFDALSLKQLIKQRLNEGGAFTDQNYEGSNISAIIDIIAYSYHTLLFYLNQTSSESMFTDTSIYENMNRIVKMIDYKPTGYQTSLLSFKVTATEDLPAGTYTIPRYASFDVNGNKYSFIDDVTFTKTTAGEQVLKSVSDENLLYQGSFIEHPPQGAFGEDFEVITLATKDTVTQQPFNIDEESVDIYVRDTDTGKFTQYTEVDNMFLQTPSAKVYEKRINENGLYEFKFGNSVFGNRLKAGDQVYIYYVKSDGASGEIDVGDLDDNQLTLFSTPLFERITNDVYADQNLTLITPTQLLNLDFANTVKSTPAKEIETVDEIRVNAPKTFQRQNRLVTQSDYEVFLNKEFSNILESFSVVNNNEFIDGYLNYFYQLGLDKPNDDPRFLFNQVKFASTANINNVYMFLVPKVSNVSSNNDLNYLTASQKNLILDEMSRRRMLNVELVPQDPVYIGVTLGIKLPTEELTVDVKDETYLIIKKDQNSRLGSERIKQQANNIFKSYFKSIGLGSTIGILELKNQLFTIPGVKDVLIRKGTLETPNISLVIFNSIYPTQDIDIITADTKMPFYKFPYLYNDTILDNIIVEDAQS